jgi:DMSO/TMAO reductase YedYZ heme-binding membrane subunit
MLQRIQTIWLLAASAAAFITLKLSFFSGNKYVDNVKTFEELNGMSHVILMILTVALAVASLIIIFLYKDRKLQLKLTIAAFALSLLNLFVYYLQIKKFIPAEGKISITAIVAIIIPALILLAARAIWKDEQLIKSVDRLR